MERPALPVILAGPAGALEALYRPGAQTSPPLQRASASSPPQSPSLHLPESAALLCHPHPLYGGTMHNRVLFHFVKALAATGRATLRFNFRGVGASTGVHDEGRGEADDVRAAAADLLTRSGASSLDVLGYSFGCWVSWRGLGADPRVRTLTGIGVALRLEDFSFARRIPKPITIVQGEEDEFGGADEVGAFAASLSAPSRLFLIGGADHLFTRGWDRLLASIPEIVAGL